MSTYVYFDLETIPSQDPALMDKFRAEVKAPATFKKPESIAEWLAENRESTALETMAKTSFDPMHGHICTIAFARDGGDIEVCHAETLDDEKAILTSFFAWLDPYHSETLVGHYISGFDVPFLLKRAVILGVAIPSAIPRDPKPWDKSLNDTMVMWSGAKGSISMDKLAAGLGIQGKSGFDGSMVAQAWADGQHETIAEYCKDDVRMVREIHRRFLAVGW